jgi:tRNA threonylcarbamoyladenosine biosynthesis protein TsaB
VLILGIETTTTVSSVAVWDDEGSRASLEVARGRGHVEALVPTIEQAFDGAGCSARDLTAVAVGIGPGLFTSMRVGIATAKTIAATLDLPMVGVSGLDVLAFDTQGRVCVCIDARRGEVYGALYEDGARIDDPALWNPADLREHAGAARFFGDAARLVSDDGEEAYPDADTLCRIALARCARGDVVDHLHIEPLYVRRTDAEINWERRGVSIERPLRVKIPKRATR